MSTPLTPGKYKGTLVNWYTGESKTKGTPFIAAEFSVAGMAAEVTFWIPGRDASEERKQRHVGELQRLGWNGEYDGNALAFAYKGREFDLTLKYEEYNGKQQARWQLGFPVQALSADRAAELKREMAKYLAATPPAPTGTRPAPPAAASAPYGKAEAWAQYVADAARGGHQPDAALWTEAVKATMVNAGKTSEASLTSDDWRAVPGAILPF